MHSSKFLAPTCSYLLLARRLGVCLLWNVSASQNEMPCHSLGMKCSLTLQTSLLILGGSGANMNRTAFLKLSSTQNPDMQKWGPFIPPGAAIKWYDHSVFHFFLGCDDLLWWDCRYLFYLREKKKSSSWWQPWQHIPVCYLHVLKEGYGFAVWAIRARGSG